MLLYSDCSVYLWSTWLFDLNIRKGTLILCGFLPLNSYLQNIILQNLTITKWVIMIWHRMSYINRTITRLWRVRFWFSAIILILLLSFLMILRINLKSIILIRIHLNKLYNYKENLFTFNLNNIIPNIINKYN